MLNFLPLTHTPYISIPITLLSSLPDVLPC